MNTTIESENEYDLPGIVRYVGRHTVCYTVNASEYFADFVPQMDVCGNFRLMMSKDTVRVENGGFVLRACNTYYEGDGRNEPRYECEDSEDVPIGYCPFCGAELVVGEDIIEDGGEDGTDQ